MDSDKPKESFQFFVHCDDGVNLYVDLNSSPTDWIKACGYDLGRHQNPHCLSARTRMPCLVPKTSCERKISSSPSPSPSSASGSENGSKNICLQQPAAASDLPSCAPPTKISAIPEDEEHGQNHVPPQDLPVMITEEPEAKGSKVAKAFEAMEDLCNLADNSMKVGFEVTQVELLASQNIVQEEPMTEKITQKQAVLEHDELVSKQIPVAAEPFQEDRRDTQSFEEHHTSSNNHLEDQLSKVCAEPSQDKSATSKYTDNGKKSPFVKNLRVLKTLARGPMVLQQTTPIQRRRSSRLVDKDKNTS